MKNVVRMFTHMLLWASIVLLCWGVYHSREEMLLYSGSIAVSAGVCYVMRTTIKKLWLFLLCHILEVIGGVAVVVFLKMPLWYLVFFILLVLYSVFLRCAASADDLDEPTSIYVSVAVAVYLIIWFFEGDPLAENISLVIVVLMFLMKLLYGNLKSADWFIKSRNLSEDPDAKRANSFSKQISMLYTGAMSILVGLIALISMEEIWEAIKTGVERLMTYLVGLIPEGEPQVMGGTRPENQGEIGDMRGLIGQIKTSPVMEALDEMLSVLALVLLVATIAMAIAGIIVSAYKAFYRKREREEDTLFIEKLTAQTRLTQGKKRKADAVPESATAKRIRRIYKRNMNRLDGKKRKDFPRIAPDKQVKTYQEIMGEQSGGDEICELYEKARYSQGNVTDADVARMRTIM